MCGADGAVFTFLIVFMRGIQQPVSCSGSLARFTHSPPLNVIAARGINNSRAPQNAFF
jgi:hypothetical protein